MDALEEVKRDYVRPLAARSDVDFLCDLKSKLLPCEKIARRHLVSESLGYPRIDLEFLRMRNADGLPRFAPIPVWESEVHIVVTAYVRRYYTRSNIDELWDYFDDVGKTLYKRRGPFWQRVGGFEHIIIRYRFSGILPAKVRERIASLSKKMNRIYLIVESPSWEKTESITVSRGDPLVVGLHENGDAFLIDAFDLAPIEDMVRHEFTSGSLAKNQ